MDKALYIAMTGAKHNMLAQTAHSNNLANANTSGFRADFAQARSMGVYYGEGHPTRAYSLTERPATDFRPGTVMETGRELDVAIQGEGFIAVESDTGEVGLTRAGNLYIDTAGILRTGANQPVLGSGGPISIPPAEKIDIGKDGTISVVLAGGGREPQVLDQIRLVNPAAEDLVKREDGLVYVKDGGQAAIDLNVTLLAGFTESSNVNTVHEFTEILSKSRQYEMQLKLMKTVERNSETSARLLQMS
ncbi:flagellar basal-body rod protein FlgF [Maricurvus nonylphenolicus]|uniref:flagellar basal body rod protein FlgF n=1 Tax=Maricurvus nonylphenolicus TaxID=1008307 RepID=UPI0036F35B62